MKLSKIGSFEHVLTNRKIENTNKKDCIADITKQKTKNSFLSLGRAALVGTAVAVAVDKSPMFSSAYDSFTSRAKSIASTLQFHDKNRHFFNVKKTVMNSDFVKGIKEFSTQIKDSRVGTIISSTKDKMLKNSKVQNVLNSDKLPKIKRCGKAGLLASAVTLLLFFASDKIKSSVDSALIESKYENK